MKKQLLFLLIIILSFNCYSQISFEKGYYIDNSNQKINCLIKNIDWKNNPTEFEYKLSENSESEKATIKSIKEFGINTISKYVRSTVKIDRSTSDVNKLSTNRNPIFNEEQLFLKVLVEGNATLYAYVDGSLNRFFYDNKNSDIKQLVFKTYTTPSGNYYADNNLFRQQLLNNLNCPRFKINRFENLDYKKEELVILFLEFNECFDNKAINFEEKQKRDLFNLNIRPGLNNSSLSIQNRVSGFRNTDFDNEFGFRFGLEAEFITAFNKNKWSLLIEPTYQYFKSVKEITNQSVEADYKSIEIPVGVRHYFFLNENSKIFINGSFIFDLGIDSVIEFESAPDLEIKTSSNLAFGIGYKHNDRYGLELRYQTSREILSNFSAWSSDYNTLSVIFGYSLF